VVEPKTPAKRTRARAVKKPVAEPAEVVETGETAAESVAEPVQVEPAAVSEEPEVKAPRTRTRRTATTRSRRAAPEAPVEEPAAVEERVEKPVGAEEERAAGESGAAPVAFATTFSQPAFVTPAFSASAPAPAVPVVPETTEEDEAAGPVDVVFQPPMVVFQPPQATAAAPAVRRPAAAAQPAPAAIAEMEEIEDLEDLGDEQAEAASEEDESADRPSRRRRRRGGRGRGRVRDENDENEPQDGADADGDTSGNSPQDEDDTDTEGPAGEDEEEENAGGSSRRRRRRRRRGGGDDEEASATPDDPPNTVVRVRAPRAAAATRVRTSFDDEVQSVRGSTRLEAKKQRRREGRDQGRRRPPIVTESEFLARREAVDRVMVVRQEGERTQIGVLEDGVLVEHYVDRASHQSYVGNVYLGKVQNVLPSMEAAFVDVGKGRNAVLYAGEVNWDVAGLVGQPRRIEAALKSGQSVLVQVTKDPLGHKGARLTSQVSLPGRYLVYVPDGSMTGISRKLPDKERARLKAILRKVMPEHAGVIVRTAAEGASEEELAGDVQRLAAQWEEIQKKAKTASAPSLLHGEPDMTIRVIRDIFNEDFAKLVVAGDAAWEIVQDYVSYVAPHLAERVEHWETGGDAFAHYRIDEQLAKALERKVWLPSGGSLVIDRTEAMSVVDVNTGKFTGQGGNLEETVTRNNLEAAEEIVRQLRLRDIGGIIVVDFIDMVLESNRDLVLRRLLECLARDRTKHQVAEVTSLGLVQMTRKRVGSGLLEAFSEVCECCSGRGVHVQLTPVEEKPDPNAAGNGRKRKRKGEVERVVEAKIAQAGRAAAQVDHDDDDEPEIQVAVAVAEPLEIEPPAATARTRRVRRTRPAGPPPEEPEEIGNVAITLDTGEVVRVDAVVGAPADPESEPGENPVTIEVTTVTPEGVEITTITPADDEEGEGRRTRRPRRLTRKDKIEAAKTDD
ncbi:MAG: Rne/Rng family ribonuclease, partial [Streptosporangiaceae bacterium]